MPIPGDTSTASPVRERLRADLRLVPRQASIVASLDLERLRGTAVWKELAAGPIRDASLLIEGLTKGMGIDPMKQVRQVLVAVPGESQSDHRFVAILRIDRLDQARAAAWLGRRQDDEPIGLVLPPDRVVIARGAWATEIASQGRAGHLEVNADGDSELYRLCVRAAGDHPFWLAVVVPMRLRRKLIDQARFPDVASLARMRLSVDVDRAAPLPAEPAGSAHDRKLRAELVGELSNDPDARALASRLGSYLDAAKRRPDMLAQGLAPHLEALRLDPRGPNVHASLTLPAGQVGVLVPRLGDLLRSALPPRGHR